MLRHFWCLSPFVIPPIDIPNLEGGEFTGVDTIETRGIDRNILSRLRKIEFVKHMHSAGLAEKVVNTRVIAHIVGQNVVAARFRKQSKLFRLELDTPVAKFPTDCAVAFECL